MSEESVKILRGILSEMARGNFWALAPYLDAEVEWIWAPEFQGIVGEKIFRGPEGVKDLPWPRGSRSRYPGVFRAMGAIHLGGRGVHRRRRLGGGRHPRSWPLEEGWP